jgi:hypothetical protein
VEAGARPKNSAVAAATAAVNASTRPSSRASIGIGVGPPPARRRSARLPQNATRVPSAPPAAASTRLSMSSCCTRRTRLAPIAIRTLISRPREAARASSRFATFAQITSSTSATATVSVTSAAAYDRRYAEKPRDAVADRHARLAQLALDGRELARAARSRAARAASPRGAPPAPAPG